MKQEIKCPHCHEWTLWRGHIDDRCLYCGEFLQVENFTKSVETKIQREVNKENDYLFIHENDSKLVKSVKTNLRPFRRLMVYLQVAFVIFMSILIWIMGFLTA